MATYAIGDIHGCARSLEALVEKLKLSKEDYLVLVGDYVDRGPDSKGVFDLIFKLQDKGYHIHCIRGNHEQILLRGINGKADDRNLFRSAGGKATIDSFGVKKPGDIPKKYLKFIDQLPYFYQTENYIFVHGGLEFRNGSPLLYKEDMLWKRYWYGDIDYDWLGKRIIIHGHTPTPLAEAQLQIENIRNNKDQVLNLDTGCVYHTRPEMGILTAVNLEKMELITQEYIG